MPKLDNIISKRSIDRIGKWLNNPEIKTISDNDKKIFERMKFAYDRLQIHNKKRVAASIRKTYDVSLAMAYKYIKDAITVFNPINRHDKEFMKTWIIDKLIVDIQRIRSKPEPTATDNKALSGFYANLIKIMGFDRTDIEEIDPSLLGHNQLIANFQFNNKNITINFDKNNNKEEIHAILQNSDTDIGISEAKEMMFNEEDSNNQ